MKSNYKHLGDYIRQVDVRNRDLSITDLVGLTIAKSFIPSVANTIGTDLSTYKVIRYGQFACSLMQVSRDGKMPVAMFDRDAAIISPAYPMFEVSKPEYLMPKFLMMWFSRCEFDREATFYAVGGVRGSLTWEDFCDMKLLVPPIEEQQKIVAEYQAIERRIKNNRCLISTLEATAQSIYRHFFVDDIDPENLPDGWHIGSISEIADLRVGGDKPEIFSPVPLYNCNVPIFANGVIDDGLYGFTNKPKVFEDSFTISARGTIGVCFLRLSPYFPIVRLISVVPKQPSYLYFLFHFVKEMNIEGDGSVQNQLTVPFLNSEKIIIPPHNLAEGFYNSVDKIYRYIFVIRKEIELDIQFASLLLTKLSR